MQMLPLCCFYCIHTNVFLLLHGFEIFVYAAKLLNKQIHVSVFHLKNVFFILNFLVVYLEYQHIMWRLQYSFLEYAV